MCSKSTDTLPLISKPKYEYIYIRYPSPFDIFVNKFNRATSSAGIVDLTALPSSGFQFKTPGNSFIIHKENRQSAWWFAHIMYVIRLYLCCWKHDELKCGVSDIENRFHTSKDDRKKKERLTILLQLTAAAKFSYSGKKRVYLPRRTKFVKTVVLYSLRDVEQEWSRQANGNSKGEQTKTLEQGMEILPCSTVGNFVTAAQRSTPHRPHNRAQYKVETLLSILSLCYRIILNFFVWIHKSGPPKVFLPHLLFGKRVVLHYLLTKYTKSYHPIFATTTEYSNSCIFNNPQYMYEQE